MPVSYFNYFPIFGYLALGPMALSDRPIILDNALQLMMFRLRQSFKSPIILLVNSKADLFHGCPKPDHV